MKNVVMISLILASLILLMGVSGCAPATISTENNQTSEGNSNSMVEVQNIIFTLPDELPEAEAGSLYTPYSFCQPDSAGSGATCGGLAGDTTNPTGGNPPYTFSVEFGGGFLPTGMALELNGLLRGTPILHGTYNFGICAKDSNGEQVCKKTSITVTEPSGMQVRGQITDKDTGKMVEGAVVKVAYEDASGIDKSIVATSGAASIDSDNNNYAMYLPYYLPENVVISVNSKGYLPASENAVVDASLEQENKYRWVNFALTPLSEKVIVIDNQLHHLGDNTYQGSANSQFQMSAEGLQYSKSFTVNKNQLGYSQALLVITSRGAEESNTITLNGQSIGSLCCSSGDGSFGTLQWNVDMSLLREGSNQLTINSALNSGSNATPGDHDDFEFIDVMMQFQ